MTTLTNVELFADIIGTTETINKLHAIIQKAPETAYSYRDELTAQLDYLNNHLDHLYAIADNRVTDSIELCRLAS